MFSSFDYSNASVLKNVAPVFCFHVAISDRLASCIFKLPAGVFTFEKTVVILDKPHNPSHFKATFEGEFGRCFHLPSRSAVTNSS